MQQLFYCHDREIFHFSIFTIVSSKATFGRPTPGTILLWHGLENRGYALHIFIGNGPCPLAVVLALLPPVRSTFVSTHFDYHSLACLLVIAIDLTARRMHRITVRTCFAI